jgi:hypothetical protein
MAVYKQRFWIPGALAAILGGVLAAKAKTSIVKGVGLATSASGGFMLAESGTLLYTANKAAAASTSGSAPAQTTQGLYEPRGTGALLEPRGTGDVYEEIGYVTELDYLPAGG